MKHLMCNGGRLPWWLKDCFQKSHSAFGGLIPPTSVKNLKILTLTMIVFIAIDFLLTGWATKLFIIRMVGENNLNISQKEETIAAYNYIYENEDTKWLSDFIYKFWGDKKMLRTFPNLKVQDVNGNIIYLDSLLPDIQPYYIKIYEKK